MVILTTRPQSKRTKYDSICITETPSEDSSVPMVMVEVVDPERQSNGSRVGFHTPAQPLSSRTPSQHSRTPSQTSWTPHHSRTPSQRSNQSQVSQTSKQSSISRDSPSRRQSHNKVAHFEEVSIVSRLT